MFRDRVADFYRQRGYEVRQDVKVRGASQNVYTLELVAEGPLGALLVSFGDAAGIDAAEVARVRTLARDIGATPVLAAPVATAELRRLAAQLTVVLLEEASLDGPAPRATGPVAPLDPLAKDLAAHPWPDSGRTGPEPGPGRLLEAEQVVRAEPTPAAWHAPKATASPAPVPSVTPTSPAPSPAAPAAPLRKFGWLDGIDPAPTGPRPALPAPVAAKPLEHEAVVESREAPARRVSMLRLALYVAAGMFVLWLLVQLFG